jgi:hypothetical protein
MFSSLLQAGYVPRAPDGSPIEQDSDDLDAVPTVAGPELRLRGAG